MALHRIEVGHSGASAAAGEAVVAQLSRVLETGAVTGCRVVDVYTLAAELNDAELAAAVAMLGHPVSRPTATNAPLHAAEGFDFAVEIGFLPGVTDNVASTARQMLHNALGRDLAEGESVHSSKLLLLTGNLTETAAQQAGETLANPLIERITVRSRERYAAEGGMPAVAPRVSLHEKGSALFVDLEVSDEALVEIGRRGIVGEDGQPRGPLALDLTAMTIIRDHFREVGRPPTDVELEALAQTWSEHCRHILFNSPITAGERSAPRGLFKDFIRKATETVREARGEDDPCISVFADNAGAVAFDDEWMVCDKVETHNSPSALDPFGGAITGILGVNRDAVGFGLGARPVLNRYGFCLPWADDERQLYRDPEASEALLEPRRLAEGIIDGVEVGGNNSGIPTPQGFLHFHDGYRAKPLVFVGTIGLMPRERGGRKLHEKAARPGDHIIVVGGRVGLDGIHGATFSSEPLAAGSPATAVQIGDPITQKLATDTLLREARDQGLYTSITDNGAGGLSCSVAEMALESGGCDVDLGAVPLKYPGMAPWQIWISESQERFTLAVAPEHVEEVVALFARRDVEATDIGTFTESGRCQVRYHGETVMDLDLEFLHEGWPRPELVGEAPAPARVTSPPDPPLDLEPLILKMIGRPGIASREELALRYDHEVQGASILKPRCGLGGVSTDTTAICPRPGSWRGVAVSQALRPEWTDREPYTTALWTVDAAVRQLVAAGAAVEDIALLDNFCWCSPREAERLWQLFEACRGCHDAAVAYGTPFISGKDSMHNDFRGYEASGDEVKLSVPPTLLVSSLAVLEDARRCVTLDFKAEDDHLFLIGRGGSLGGSLYRTLLGAPGQAESGGELPYIDLEANLKSYAFHHAAVQAGLLASSIAVGIGGVALAAIRGAIAGRHGVALDFGDDAALFNEAGGRILVSVAGQHAGVLQALASEHKVTLTEVGRVQSSHRIRFGERVDLSLADADAAYRRDWREGRGK